MTNLADIETQFCALALQISALKAAYPVEPIRLDVLPCVSLLWIGCPSAPSSTGWDQVTWTWRCSITVPNTNLEEAQNTLKSLVPSILAITRANPTLNGTCSWATVEDSRLEEPFALEESRGIRKNLYLTAQTVETFS